MGRGKVQMKRIEDKNSRLVTFSKRRTGLIKKARHLSVLCDVDTAVIVFSAGGKLYEFSSGSNNSVDRIVSRYKRSFLEAGEINPTGAGEDLELLLQCNRFRTCKEILQAVDRLADKNNAEELSVNDMTQLEQELDAALVQTRLRKTQLLMEYISTLKEKENKLNGEKEELEKQGQSKTPLVSLGDKPFGRCFDLQVASAEENIDVNDLATNSTQLITLPLFNG
ncbi:hypothetical protein SSX86_029432 [Deinandra increscens subsp. villosa]|uniref:Uncharacterized protein n=1 Tax=Deinandra increscens subsp. villosa TaxID=3103831 RepID=A0AAP0CET5_9ASTR